MKNLVDSAGFNEASARAPPTNLIFQADCLDVKDAAAEDVEECFDSQQTPAIDWDNLDESFVFF